MFLTLAAAIQQTDLEGDTNTSPHFKSLAVPQLQPFFLSELFFFLS